MYSNRKMHILSQSIMIVALIRLGTAMLGSALRLIFRKTLILTPDMLDGILWKLQFPFAVFKILTVAFVFYFAWRRLQRYTNMMDHGEMEEVRRLQEEYLGEDHSTLSMESIGQLLQIWAVIFTGAEAVSFVTAIFYRRLTAGLMVLYWDRMQYGTFVSVYNMSHGFKYLVMMTAILLGVVVTGIFLNDHYLSAVSAGIGVLFLLAFGVFQMQTVSLPGREIGIVWTSVIFHLTETLGLFLLSVYLSRKYNGL